MADAAKARKTATERAVPLPLMRATISPAARTRAANDTAA